ncbi:MAG: asparagine synthase (glutamine-hydrolyzing) [Methyloceanibacter sp.]
MCGLAGVIDLEGRRTPGTAMLQRMAAALLHRGPDEDGFLVAPGVGLAHRRLSIVGVTDGRQPLFNEDRTIAVVCNGEFFDYLERKVELEAKGHIFRTHTDTEIIVHLYEEHGEGVFNHLKGQFAFVLVDLNRRIVLLARDRVGICPLHWSRQGDWLYFGSEIKALLVSGAVVPAADLRGLDHLFTFFAMPNRRTMFEGVQSIPPGHYLKLAFRDDGGAAEIVERRYWEFDFPDAGDEDNPTDGNALIDEFEATFRRAVEIRLRADVPVVGYLSGGVDSSYVLATASSLRGKPLPSFTIGIPGPKYNETAQANVAAQHIGSRPVVVDCDGSAIGKSYADLVMAADSPVLDTSCAALFSLAREVHSQGYKVALTGEGADEAFGGYIWFKLMELSRLLDVGSLKSTTLMDLLIRKAISPHISFAELARAQSLIEGPHGQSVFYHLVAQAKRRYFNRALNDQLGEHAAYEELALDRERMHRWHPMNRSIYLGYKVHLAGLLLNHKGDRVAMASSVETRYPFLDEDVIALAARVHPCWKLSRSFKDKILLRQAAARLLPEEIAFRPKGMFRAPLAESFFVNTPPFVRQLLSEESLAATGYFDAPRVARDCDLLSSGKGAKLGTFRSLGMVGVLATQLWHHLYLGGGLCELSPARIGEVRLRGYTSQADDCAFQTM